MARFPIIRNADQVLAAIAGNHAFIVKRDEENDLLIVNYVLNTPDTFPPFGDDPVENERLALLRECRGITFRLSTGELLSRKFHKFFNMGERDETTVNAMDWTREHRILEKLDGSMITPVMVDGQVRYATKMGLTDVAKLAEAHALSFADYRYDRFCEEAMQNGLTPIFEFCSRKQRIVVDYPEDQLVLTAVRENVTGHYWDQERMESAVEGTGIPVVKAYDTGGTYKAVKDFMEAHKEMEGAEGFVVRFVDGDMVKVKMEWYLKLHKMVDLMKNERNLIQLILDEKIDDVLSMIRDEDRHAVERFEHLLQAHWTGLADQIHKYVGHAREAIREQMDNGIFEERALQAAMKKEFAVEWVKKSPISGMLFRMWDSDGSYEAAWSIVKQSVAGVLNTNTKMDANRHLIGCEWASIFGAERLAEE